jgi:hypothetical protein
MPYVNIISSNSTTSLTGGIQTLVWQDTTPADTEYDSEDSNSYVKSQSSDMKMSMKSNSEYILSRTPYSVDLIFSFVKSKFSKLEQREIEQRLRNLRLVIQSCSETGQTALADQMLIEQATAIRQQEVAAAGYDTFVTLKDVMKFKDKTKTQIDWAPLEKFPRPIPQGIRNKIATVKKKNLFDELMVLFHNPTKEQLSSTKEKIISKDPILFGRFAYAPEVLYFICDWEDEVCHLTMKEFVKQLSQADPEFETQTVKPIGRKEAEAIKERAMEKATVLNRTNRSSYKELAALDDLSNQKFSWKLVRTVLKTLWKTRKNGAD